MSVSPWRDCIVVVSRAVSALTPSTNEIRNRDTPAINRIRIIQQTPLDCIISEGIGGVNESILHKKYVEYSQGRLRVRWGRTADPGGWNR